MTTRLIERYMVKSLLDYWLLGVMVFTLVLFFSDALLDFMKDLQHYGIPWDMALSLVGLQLPKIIVMVIPMSALLATLMVYNTMNNNLELVSIRMSGVSLYRLALPALIVAIGATAFAYLLSDYVVPVCNKYARGLKTYAMNQQNLPATQENFTYKQFDDKQQLQRLIYVSQFNGNELGYSTVVDLSNKQTLQVVQARSGEWGSSIIRLKNANVYTVAGVDGVTNTTHAKYLNLQNFIRPQKKLSTYQPQEMSFVQLWVWLGQRVSRGDIPGDELYVTLWEKLAVPLSCIPLVLVAVPLSLPPPRQAKHYGFLTAIVILFIYYMMRHIFHQFGDNGSIPTFVAVWAPLAIISVAAAYLFNKKNYQL